MEAVCLSNVGSKFKKGSNKERNDLSKVESLGMFWGFKGAIINCTGVGLHQDETQGCCRASYSCIFPRGDNSGKLEDKMDQEKVKYIKKREVIRVVPAAKLQDAKLQE